MRYRGPARVSPLRSGDVGTVLETLGNNEAFLVEFNKNGKAETNACDWLGVLYPAEIEVVGQAERLEAGAGAARGALA